MSAFLLAFWMGTSAVAAGQIPDVDMHAMAREVMTLQHFMFSEADFSSPENQAAISNSFPTLEKHLDRLKAKVFTDQPALRMNASMLQDQISEADQAFRRGDKAYARYVLISSLQLCVACHTRTASADFALPEEQMKGASPLDRATYYFATRQFDKGRDLYESFLASAGKSTPPGLVRSSSLAMAVYFSRVKDDPKGGAAYFSKLGAEKNFSPKQQRQFRGWASAFGQWAREKTAEGQSLSDKQALALAGTLLKKKSESPAAEIRALRASTLLSAVLEAPGETSPNKAEALLELGNVYDGLDFPLFYRFGDMYLKTCVSEYQKTAAAQKCYDALDAFVKNRIRKGNADGAADIEEAELLKWKKIAY